MSELAGLSLPACHYRSVTAGLLLPSCYCWPAIAGQRKACVLRWRQPQAEPFKRELLFSFELGS